MNTKTTSAAAALLLGVALATAGCGRGGGDKAAAGGGAKPTAGQPAAAEATPVRVAAARETTVRKTVPVTGSIAALQSVDLAPKITARVVRVAGREGATVRKGEIVVQQDTSDLQTDVQQASANLAAARARLAQQQTQARVQNANALGEVENTRQQLRQAEAALALARKPQRTQEIAVAENAVRQAQVRYEKAQLDRKRYEGLVKEGAVAQSVLDQYVTDEKVARAAVDTAQQQLDIAQKGGRAEDIRSAEANVVRARLAVSQARTNLQQIQARASDTRAAQATVAQSQAALQFARQQLENASIRSPIDGVIAERTTEPGQLAAPGSAVLRIVALDTVYFEPQVPETAVGALRPGLPVNVSVDAFPGRAFTGKVARVYPTASITSRAFNARIVLPNDSKLLRPGMFARGDIVTQRREGVVVDKDAVLARDGKTQVFVASNGKAQMRNVQVGVQTEDTAEILSGVRAGEQVIVAGQDALKDGGAIKVETPEETQQAASAR